MAKINKIWNQKHPGQWVFLDDVCKQVHVKKRKRISMSTGRNWLKALKLAHTEALCEDGKYRVVMSEADSISFLNAYRAKQAFRVVKI